MGGEKDEEKTDQEALVALNKALHEAWNNTEWMQQQEEEYHKLAKELDEKRFRSWCGTFTSFIR